MFGRELLEKGLMKSIGNRKDTNMWFEKYDGSWDLIKLYDLFLPEYVTRICSFPPNTNCTDRYIWTYTRNISYSVKSGNWFLSKLAAIGSFKSQHVHDINALKANVYSVKTVPKVRLFL